VRTAVPRAVLTGPVNPRRTSMDSATYVIFAIAVIIVAVLAFTGSCKRK
jgi:hypothetical protein